MHTRRPLGLCFLLLGSALWTQPGWAENRAPVSTVSDTKARSFHAPSTNTAGVAARKRRPPLNSSLSKKAENATSPSSSSSGDSSPSFSDVVQDTRHIKGLFDLYANDETGELYLEIQPSQFDRLHLLVITLSQGLGELGFLEGLPLYDVPLYLRRQNDRVLVVVPNTHFRTRPGDPQTAAVERSFSESVLYSLSVVATHPERNSVLVDLQELLVDGDLSGLSAELGTLAYSFESDRSYVSQAHGFPENIELEAMLSFSGQPLGLFESVPDERAMSLGVRYSLSELPENSNYRPRLADNRVGYFVTAYRNVSDLTSSDPFVRYVQRWHLEKQDPTAALSPPVEPIVFWIENTVPEEYRAAIREGVLLWNRAFERAGFRGAIEVRQMPDDATWDPADVRYNVIRWSASFRSGFVGIGPSRVNPLTGEILDADILINANVVRYLSREYDTLIDADAQRLYVDLPGCSPESECDSAASTSPLEQLRSRFRGHRLGCSCRECTRQFQVGAMALSLVQGVLPGDPQMEKYVSQYLRYLVAHEVGHTLGLRHNFHGSTLLGFDELNDRDISQTQGLSGSVMDYLPPNIAPSEAEQGDFFPTRIGPYDEWAIEYGYTPTEGRTPVEVQQRLEAIADRAPQQELAYGTDEDLWSEIDPAVNWFDLSGDMLAHAQSQMELARQMWEQLDRNPPTNEDDYDALRVRFDFVMQFYFRQARVLLKYIGGQSFDRSRVGDFAAPLFEPIAVAEQRASLDALQQYVFAPDAFEFPPDFLNQLAPSRWYHWGSTPPTSRLDYPIHDRIFGFQRIVLRSLLSGERLTRLRDLELKTEPGEALTLPELFETLHQGIWTEVLQGRRVPTNISSVRRSLQREYLNLAIDMALGRSEVPEDARTLARYELQQLDEEIAAVLRRHDDDVDTYTRAHLEDTRSRIRQTLEAQFFSQ
ncbi:zinc-dependent metalloprotease [Baaleninema simplex]|uniref:zinc-dependent metalloprotease n=1 Tax=Baaleninema simplex TaxID=2862350 RepID=UPI000477D3CF|nr:zinc-dependent metalloprotease [Baaleninema simplex]